MPAITDHTATATDEAARIIDHLARHGVEGSEPQLHRLASLADRYDVRSAVRSLLTDPTVPAVVRERAAARVVAAFRRRSPTPAATAA